MFLFDTGILKRKVFIYGKNKKKTFGKSTIPDSIFEYKKIIKEN